MFPLACRAGLVLGWAGPSLDCGRAGLQLDHGTASQTTVRSMVATPVLGGRDECGSSWVCWQKRMKLKPHEDRAASSPKSGSQSVGLSLVHGTAFSKQPSLVWGPIRISQLATWVSKLSKSLLPMDGCQIFGFLEGRAGNLLFCHLADVTPSCLLSWLFVLLLCSYENCLCTMQASSLLDERFANILFQSLTCLFILLTRSFTEQNFKNSKSNLLIFHCMYLVSSLRIFCVILITKFPPLLFSTYKYCIWSVRFISKDFIL